jgi:hypothetical protein|tara:strand:+ start:234 stop:725 length:492 start_codon:yes stop_codon:yes gene_type:complete
MAREIKKFKIKDLKITVPSSGQWEGMEPYPYPPLKESLQKEGYKPESYDYICADDSGKVMYGSRRVWLMQNDMSMDQELEVDCQIMTSKELYAELNKKLNDDMVDMISKKDKKGDIIPAKKVTTNALKSSITNLQKRHKGKSNIAGYPYDYKVDGKVIDAGKS